MVGFGTGVLCTDYSQCFFVYKNYNERGKSLVKTVNYNPLKCYRKLDVYV